MVSRETLFALLLPLPFAALPLILVVASMGQNQQKAVVAIDTAPASQSVKLGVAAVTASAKSLGMVVLPALQPCEYATGPLIQG